MDIHARFGAVVSNDIWWRRSIKRKSSYLSSPSYPPQFASRSARRDPPRAKQSGGDSNKNSSDKFSTDWDRAWASFKRQGKKTFFSQFSPDKYVNWNPPKSEYPLSEEVDPIKRTERANLTVWTSPRFTQALAITIVVLFLLYTILELVR